jgi:imidazolonepropionase-like amidohydrolase
MVRVSRVRSRAAILLSVSFLSLALAAWPIRSADLRPDYRPAAYAIKGAKIVADAVTTFDPGTVVIRAGVIESVGPADKVDVPLDAETIDGKGLTVYPGFLDLYSTLGQPAGVTRSRTGPGRSVNYADFALASTPLDNHNGLTPEFQVASVLDLSDTVAEERRALGFSDILTAPSGSIATGQSALVSLAGLPRRESIVLTPVALHLNVKPPSDPAPPSPADEPPTPRRRRPAGERKYPTSLMGAVAHLRQAMLDAEYHQRLTSGPAAKRGPRPPIDPALESLNDARAKKLPVWWEANSRDEIHRALDLADEFGTTCVIVGGREAAKVAERLKARDVAVVFRLDFPEEPKVPTESEYRKREASDRDEPLRAIENRASKWKEWVATARELEKAGVRFAFTTDGLGKSQNAHAQVRKVIAAGLSKSAALDGLTRRAAEIAGLSGRLGTIAPGKLGHIVAWTGPYGEETSKPRYAFIDGYKFDLEKTSTARKKARREDVSSEPKPAAEKGKVESKTTASKTAGEPKKTSGEAPAAKPFVDVATEFDETRKPTIRTGGSVLIKDATILTVSAKGTITRGSILIKDGKIAAVGEDLKAPEGIAVIDASGLVAMPGIIDTHSHMAIQGDVNEMSLSVVPEVRIKDVVTGDDPAIYRTLAGGTTTARLLHGSADTIGGQDGVIKLRIGRPGREMILRQAPQGVKFALGENVTRLQGRFPNTRMGVEAVIERAFQEGRAYRDTWAAYENGKAKGVESQPPRRDLRLEALAGVLDGSVKVHCHCYRSDEILMLLGVAGRHGVRVRSLQHVLEGYKVAAEIAAHGASASTFSDWWAYKIEAADAIPYNAALLTQSGASVCIKSDSDELSRHLNLEAAKMIKYGGVAEPDALAMITINPARELGLDDRLGSIEVGKEADIALFNGHPFNAFARCELALIDGEVAFQRDRSTEAAGKRATVPRALKTPDAAVLPRVVTIAPNPGRVYALVGANVHPVSGPDVAGGTVIVADGKIAAVGGPETPVPPLAQTIDLKGLDVWPGMVDAGSPLGLYEIGSLRETQDAADSAQHQPELRTSSALHPDSELIPATRGNGVLAALVQPTGGVIAGQSCVIGLDGWVPREMVLADPVALHVNIPTYVPPPEGAEAGRSPASDVPDPRQRRRERIDELKEQFRLAVAYRGVRKAASEGHAASPPPDPRLDALAPYVLGEKPVIFHAEHRAEILDALKLARELKLKAIISGGRDAWKVADALKEAGVPVLVSGTLRLPGERFDPYDAPYANPARLFQAGVSFAIRSKDGGPDAATAPRNLPYEAATAIAFGLPEIEAIKAVTLTPATILGVADQVGSIDVGKRANLVITAGHILQPTTEVKALFLNGEPLAPESRHTRLYERYRKRLESVRSGASPRGLELPASPFTVPASANGGHGAAQKGAK